MIIQISSSALSAQTREAPKSARVGRAAKERAPLFRIDTSSPITFVNDPKVPDVILFNLGRKGYTILVELGPCERRWGDRDTPDIPWTLRKDYTWMQCLDRLKRILTEPLPEEWKYTRDSIINDFMQMPDYTKNP